MRRGMTSRTHEAAGRTCWVPSGTLLASNSTIPRPLPSPLPPSYLLAAQPGRLKSASSCRARNRVHGLGVINDASRKGGS
jgi:hypothetical protein